MVKTVALVFGTVFILIAAWGFFLTGTSMDADMATAPRILGLFSVNLLHNVVHLVFGVWGLLAARSWPAAYTYCRVGGIIYLILAVLGYFVSDGFGLVPIGGHDVWLHFVLGAALLGASFARRVDSTPAGTTEATRI